MSLCTLTKRKPAYSVMSLAKMEVHCGRRTQRQHEQTWDLVQGLSRLASPLACQLRGKRGTGAIVSRCDAMSRRAFRLHAGLLSRPGAALLPTLLDALS